MWRVLARAIRRRCRLCGARIEGEGVRRGLRVFCSPTHLQEHLEEQALKRLAVSRMMRDLMRNRRGGCC
ncbi:MAG: hypothetical protein HYV62_03500 [Candidatus Rokubacteria bacterium]|nr:hypothetical protein [Candidatus Rokubacteria bacterium]